MYVPAGMYSFKGPVTVPTGVELRGSSAAPHHTAAGGSILLVRYGKGDENGAPLISLAPKSGLRGVLVWYPENPIYAPEPYPWAVRSLGEDTWLADVCIANAWRGADFATHPSGGHRIAYLSGVAWQKMLVVGNSSRRGWVEETLFNPHYSQRLAFNLPHVNGKPPAGCPSGGKNIPVQSWNMRRRLEAHVFTDCADERIRGTFVFAAKDGMAFRGKNRATVMMHGADTIARGVELEQAEGSRVDAALVQVTPYETASGKESAGFHFAPGDKGTAVFRASQLWVPKPSVIAEGEGLGVSRKPAVGAEAERDRGGRRAGRLRDGELPLGADHRADGASGVGGLSVLVQPGNVRPEGASGHGARGADGRVPDAGIALAEGAAGGCDD